MIQHSPISMVKYYISKLCSTLLTFMLSIIVVFSIGHFVRGVNLPMVDWLLIAVILLVGSVVFIAMGVLVSLLPSAQLMSVVGNIVYMALAVLGGLWFPLTMFPKWLQPIGKLTPSLSTDAGCVFLSRTPSVQWQGRSDCSDLYGFGQHSCAAAQKAN